LLIVAHRGAHAPETEGVRENTVEAFRAAVDRGAGGVELDVRRTADGVLVVHHDPSVPGAGAIATMVAADLPAWLPSLDDALTACEGLTLVDVEIKNSPLEPGFDPAAGFAADVVRVALASPVGDRVLVSCFHLATLDAARAAEPHLPTAWLTVTGYDQDDAIRSAVDHGHSALAPPDAATTESLVGGAHHAGLDVLVWTVNDPARMGQLDGWGVDACITDRPGLAASARGRSGSGRPPG
jgi:glycerophosphoryl diester phosphodiesterase